MQLSMATTPFHFYLVCEHGIAANFAHALQQKFASTGPTASWTAHCLYQKVKVILVPGWLPWSKKIDSTNLY